VAAQQNTITSRQNTNYIKYTKYIDWELWAVPRLCDLNPEKTKTKHSTRTINKHNTRTMNNHRTRTMNKHKNNEKLISREQD
jgi:hypothetical protein